MIAIRMLLKSCAMPPASSPSEASLLGARALFLHLQRVGDVAEGHDHPDGAAGRIAQRRRALFDRTLGEVARNEQRAARRRRRRRASGGGWPLRVVARLARLGIEGPKHGVERLADGLVVRPAGERLGHVVDQQDRAVQIRRDHAVADAAQRDREPLLFVGERPLGAPRLEQRLDRFAVQLSRFLDVPLLVLDAAEEDVIACGRSGRPARASGSASQ